MVMTNIGRQNKEANSVTNGITEPHFTSTYQNQSTAEGQKDSVVKNYLMPFEM
uniref:Uncharacterized protein n=1 Tax=Anguilla anguilla TaxID=7936 RepID=A0A0E9RLM6_ANGAN